MQNSNPKGPMNQHNERKTHPPPQLKADCPPKTATANPHHTNKAVGKKPRVELQTWSFQSFTPDGSRRAKTRSLRPITSTASRTTSASSRSSSSGFMATTTVERSGILATGRSNESVLRVQPARFGRRREGPVAGDFLKTADVGGARSDRSRVRIGPVAGALRSMPLAPKRQASFCRLGNRDSVPASSHACRCWAGFSIVHGPTL